LLLSEHGELAALAETFRVRQGGFTPFRDSELPKRLRTNEIYKAKRRHRSELAHTRAVFFDYQDSQGRLATPFASIDRYPPHRVSAKLIRMSLREPTKFDPLGFGRFQGEAEPSHWMAQGPLKRRASDHNWKYSHQIIDVPCQ
jgi:hypothetical protein